MIQFHTPDILTTGQLSPEDSGHCCRVLRMQEGDEIIVTDGKGHRYHCILSDANPKRARVEIVSTETVMPHWGFRITLAVAPTKNIDRIEWLLEKAVEIGVDEIVMLRCSHSERKTIKKDRLERVMVSAMKQSLKATLPLLSDDCVPLRDFLKRDLPAQRYVGYCDSSTERTDFCKICRPGEDLVVMIGPEGDFSPEEINAARENGFIPVTFGESRLRTETAALYGLTVAHVINDSAR